MLRLSLVLVLSAFLALAARTADAQEKVFRYAASGDILGLDPHAHNNGPTNAMKGNLYGSLIHRRPDLSLAPDLATEWERVDETTWIFTLRDGVTFHNGNPFAANDVIYSFERQRQPGAEMATAVASIATIEPIDDLTIEVKTSAPDPTLLLNLPLFFIVDEEYTEENDGFDVALAAGAQSFVNTNANGTGPFRLVEWVQDNRLEVERNAHWWGHGDDAGNVERAIFTPIGNDATRVAALLSGEVDMMYPIPLQDVPRLTGHPDVAVLQGPELRTIFFGFDQHRDELLDMPGSGENPLKDGRVRRAFALAIDKEGIKRVVMRDAATPTGLMIAPGIEGFQEDMNTPYPFEPEQAKLLLAEAGYPDGFPITLDCPNDRYVNDEAICTAMIPMLERVGIDVTLNAQPRSLHFNKIGAPSGYDTSFYMLGWTPGSFDAHNVLQNIITLDGPGQGTWNSGRYSNPRIEELTDLIASTVDSEARDALIREAFQIHYDEVGHLPLHQQALAWGVRTDAVAEIVQRPFDDVDLRYVTLD